MVESSTPTAKLWRYRFTRPGDVELGIEQLAGDDAAESRARELSASENTAVVVQRHSGHVDAWEYVTEVDESA